MRKYVKPEIEAVTVESSDIITASPGTETPLYSEFDGNWEFSVNS